MGSIGPQLQQRIVNRSDHIAQDLDLAGPLTYFAKVGHWHREVSPYSPIAIATLLRLEKDLDDAQMKQWEEEFNKFPSVLVSLAIRYERRDRFDEAERCLLRYANEAPDEAVYRMLAQAYLHRHKTDEWRAALEKSLKYEDFSVTHAQSCAAIRAITSS